MTFRIEEQEVEQYMAMLSLGPRVRDLNCHESIYVYVVTG
jgi:hypothetical protein